MRNAAHCRKRCRPNEMMRSARKIGAGTRSERRSKRRSASTNKIKKH